MLRDRRYNIAKVKEKMTEKSKKLYELYVKAFSEPRMKKYLDCSYENFELAIIRYRLNIALSATLLRELSKFEIILRNRIHEFYLHQFNDSNWPLNFTNEKDKRRVDDFSLGFWVSLFAPIQFRKGHQRLHKIYIKRPKGIAPKKIYQDLLFVQRLRNRIAHHESICFNKNNEFDLMKVYQFEEIIFRHSNWLGIQPTIIYQSLPK